MKKQNLKTIIFSSKCISIIYIYIISNSTSSILLYIYSNIPFLARWPGKISGWSLRFQKLNFRGHLLKLPNSYSSLVPNVVDLAFLVKGKPPGLIIGPIWTNFLAIGIHAPRSLAWSAITIFISILVSLVFSCSACIFTKEEGKIEIAVRKLFSWGCGGISWHTHRTDLLCESFAQSIAE